MKKNIATIPTLKFNVASVCPFKTTSPSFNFLRIPSSLFVLIPDHCVTWIDNNRIDKDRIRLCNCIFRICEIAFLKYFFVQYVEIGKKIILFSLYLWYACIYLFFSQDYCNIMITVI